MDAHALHMSVLRDAGACHVHAVTKDDLPLFLPAHHAELLIIVLWILCRCTRGDRLHAYASFTTLHLNLPRTIFFSSRGLVFLPAYTHGYCRETLTRSTRYKLWSAVSFTFADKHFVQGIRPTFAGKVLEPGPVCCISLLSRRKFTDVACMGLCCMLGGCAWGLGCFVVSGTLCCESS